MLSHKQKIEKHAINNKINLLQEKLVNELQNTSYSQNVIDEFSRELEVINFVNEIVENADIFLSLDTLDKAVGTINNIIDNFNKFISGKNETYVDNMMTYCDQLIYHLRGIKITDAQEYLITEKYAQHLRYVIGQLSTQVSCVKAENIELKENITSQKETINHLETIVGEKLRNLENDAAGMIDRLESKIDDFKARMEADFDRQKQRNEEKLNKVVDEFTIKLSDKNDDFGKVLSNTRIKLETLQSDTGKEIDKYIETVKNIVGQVNTTMFSYKYQQVADDAKSRAFHWNVIFFILMIASVMLAYCTMDFIKENKGNEHFAYAFLSRSAMIMISLTAGGYCGKQASNQGKIERYARKIEMELVAFDTFVENLPNELKQQLKSEVVKRIFINRENIIENVNDDQIFTDKITENLLKKLLSKSDANEK